MLVGSGPQARDHADLRRARRAERGRARRRHARAAALGVHALPARARGRAAARCSRARRSSYRRGAELDAGGGRHGRAASCPPRPARCAAAALRVPDRGRRARSARGQKLGEVDVCRGKTKLATLPVVASADVPDGGPRGAHQGPLHAAAGRCCSSCCSRWAVRVWLARVRRRGPRRAPRLARGAGGRMIITVTLNTAIDKTLAVPELPPRPAPPHGRADDDAGRQGRQRRARAQDARPAGDRHRARRRRRPARASSSSSPSCRCSPTSCASARSRARTPP